MSVRTIVRKSNCIAVHENGCVIGTFAGPDSEEHAAQFAALSSSGSVPGGHLHTPGGPCDECEGYCLQDAAPDGRLTQLTIEREAAQSGLDAAMKALQSYAAIKGVPRRSVSMASIIPGQWKKKLEAIDAAIAAIRASKKGEQA